MKEYNDPDTGERNGRMRTYTATVIKEYYCAFRCAYCHEMNVTKGKLTASSGGNMNKALAASLARQRLMKTLPKFYEKVNEQHNTAKIHADTTCSYCGRKQEWGYNTFLPTLILTILTAALLFVLLRFVIARTGDTVGMIVASVVIGMCFWPLCSWIADSACGKISKKKLDANPTPECCPYVGDIYSISEAGETKSDDARIKAILAEQLKAVAEKKAEEEQKKTGMQI